MPMLSATSLELTAAYARVSTPAQGEDVKTSLRTQLQTCQQDAPAFGLVVDPECVAQEPYTATTLERPALELLLATMRRRGIRHLLMDKTDRVTRGGQIDAATFLQRLRDYDITLHLAQERLTLDNDNAVAMFLMFAFAAKVDNTNRTLNVQRNRREAARSLGRYARGNRPPYGWQFVTGEVDTHSKAINFRLVHHPETFPVLQRMIRERQQGRGYWGIAKRLTEEGIPTPVVQADQHKPGEDDKPWQASTVQRVLKNPINAGIVTSFRERRTEMPPDARHPRRWYKAIKLPVSEQIALPSDLVQDPPLTVAEYRWLISREARARWSGGTLGTGARGGKLANLDNLARPMEGTHALCAGGLLGHTCGGTVRVKHATRRNLTDEGIHHYHYYVCRTHEYTPTACPGFTTPMEPVDALVWEAVRRALLTPGRLEQMAEAQRQADLAEIDTGAGGLRHLRQVRDDLVRQVDNLVDSIKHSDSPFVRRRLEADLALLEPQLADAEEHLAEQEAVAANDAYRQAVLAHVQAQIGRYAIVVGLLHLVPDTARRVAVQRRVLRALGFQGTLSRQDDGRVRIDAELRLSAGQASVPWFDPEDMQRTVERVAAEYAAGTSNVSPETFQMMLEDMAAALPKMRQELLHSESEGERWRGDSRSEQPQVWSGGQPSAPQPADGAGPIVVETETGILTFAPTTTSSR